MTPSDRSDPTGDSLSIFCPDADFSLVAKVLDSYPAVVRLEDETETTTVQALCGGHEIRFSALPWTGPGEPLAKTILGALTYVRRIPTVHDRQKQELLSALAGCRLLIGVAGSPGCLTDAACLGVVHAIASRAKGMLFDGADFRSAAGDLLLSYDGRSDGD